MNAQHESAAMIQKLARGELSFRTRLGYVALLLAATGMTAVVLSLWISEPHLVPRTQFAFGVMSCIGASWAAFALWSLTTRRVLLALDRVIAGRMAVVFCAVFVAGAVAATFIAGNVASFAALATGLLMLGAAARVLSGARRRFAELTARRAELERAIGLATR